MRQWCSRMLKHRKFVTNSTVTTSCAIVHFHTVAKAINCSERSSYHDVSMHSLEHKMCFQSVAHTTKKIKKNKFMWGPIEFCTLKAFKYCRVKWAKPNITSLGTHWRFNHMLKLTRSRSFDASLICRRFSFFYCGRPWLTLWRSLLGSICYRTNRLWPYCNEKYSIYL